MGKKRNDTGTHHTNDAHMQWHHNYPLKIYRLLTTAVLCICNLRHIRLSIINMDFYSRERSILAGAVSAAVYYTDWEVWRAERSRTQMPANQKGSACAELRKQLKRRLFISHSLDQTFHPSKNGFGFNIAIDQLKSLHQLCLFFLKVK